MATLNVLRKSTNRVQPAIRFHFDYWMLLSIAGLIVIGMLTVYSTTFDLGLLAKNNSNFYITRQFYALGLGLVGMLIIMQFDYHILRKLSVPFLGLSLLGLLLLLIVGEVSLGAVRGFYEGSFQPSEVAKLAIILYISHWLSSKGERIKMLTYGLVPFSVITGVVCAFIVRQPDLSTAVLVALVSFTLFFVAGADLKQFGLAGGIGGVVFVFLMFTLPHAAARFEAYSSSIRNPEEASYHMQQTLVALARGGWTGVGLGKSIQKFGPLPAAHTDGAFAILAEEMGLLGSMIVIGLMAMLVWRGIRTALNARDSYGSLLALGITCWFAYQALINIAVITAVIPFTGIPLPFISYGGSSLLITLIGAGILLNISRDGALTKRSQPARRTQEN